MQENEFNRKELLVKLGFQNKNSFQDVFELTCYQHIFLSMLEIFSCNEFELKELIKSRLLIAKDSLNKLIDDKIKEIEDIPL